MKRTIRLLYVITIGVMLFLAFGYTAEPVVAADYYSSIGSENTGDTLLSELFTLIDDDGVTSLAYDDLWAAYSQTDTKLGTNLIWDMYSNTNYVSMDSSVKGTVSSGEGTSYNREHAICQSFFDSAYPMVSDLHYIYPVDGYSNSRRNAYLYGEVDTTKTVKYTSNNGSMLGTNANGSITVTVNETEYTYSDVVFEINDQYKGDIARAYLYFATRYKDQLGTYITNTSNAKYIYTASYPYLTEYAYDLFMSWNYEDPVSEKETARNEAVYALQGNRNPYIDHPEYVSSIWSSYADTYGYTGDFTYATLTVDEDAVSDVEALIDAIPDTELDYYDRKTVCKASDAYLLLNDSEKASVDGTKYSRLLTALSTVAELKEEDPGNVTYTVASSSSVTVTGTAPDYSSASFTSSGSQKDRLIKGDTMTFTLSGYGNTKITGIAFNMKSNMSSGSGYISVTAGDQVIYSLGSSESGVAFSDETFNGSYFGAYQYFIPTITEYTVPNGVDVTVTLGGTTNSIYCNKLSITYEDLSTGVYDSVMKFATKSSMRFHYADYTKTVTKDYYELLTDASELTTGSQFVIANAAGTYGMGAVGSSSNNFDQQEISVKNNVIEDVTGLTVITVEDGNSSGTLAFKTSGGYLGNGSADKNYLKQYTKKTSDNYAWTVSIDSDGVATIKVYGSTINSNIIQYNSSNKIFSCYASGKQADVAIYIKKTGSTFETHYNYSNMYLQYGALLSKELYDAVYAEDAGTEFGVELSKDGTSYTAYAVTPVRVSNSNGVTTESSAGDYYQYYVAVPVESDDYGTVIYARAYVKTTDGTYYYLSAASYSVKTLAAAYTDMGVSGTAYLKDLVA